MTQKETLDILKTGANVFLTGAAGSGKTHVLREYLACLKERKIPVGVTASTGIAATHMGGVTIHSWSGIGIKDELSDWDIDAISQREKTASRIQNAKVLLIDEISMLHHFQLDMVNRVLKYVRNSPAPFGGLQVIVCGDFFQLPPIARRARTLDENGMLFVDEYDDASGKAKFAYHSRAWREADFTVCYLEENYRQSDLEYLRVLNAVRNASVTSEIVEILKGRFRGAAHAEEGSEVLKDCECRSSSSAFPQNARPLGHARPCVLGNAATSDFAAESQSFKTSLPSSACAAVAITRLYSHNANVDAENDKELSKINASLQKYEMTSRGKKNLLENLKRSCLAPEILKLKEGAKVMFVKNNFEKGFVNGTLGTVKKCNPFEIVVVTTKGHIRVERETWTLADQNGKILAEIEQYPLRLAWAITIHKSQGMSLDAAEIDLSQSFEKGMGYVALSRVRTLAGLSLIGLNETALHVHEEAIEFDKHFRELSNKAAAELAVLSGDELRKRQVEFLGPEPVVKKSPAPPSGRGTPFFKGGIDAVCADSPFEKGGADRREAGDFEPKLSSIGKTKRLLDAGMKLKDAAAERGLKIETIVNHIEEIKKEDPLWNISRFKSIIPEKRLAKILEAFKDSKIGEDGLPFLSPAKKKLGAGYSWEELKIARLFL